MRWVERYENDDSIKRHNRKSVSYKVKKEHIKFVLEEIKKNKTITIEVLLSKLKDKYKDLELTRRQNKKSKIFYFINYYFFEKKNNN